MEVKCKKCSHTWEYRGKSIYYATCGMCQNKTKLQNEKKETNNIQDEE